MIEKRHLLAVPRSGTPLPGEHGCPLSWATFKDGVVAAIEQHDSTIIESAFPVGPEVFPVFTRVRLR
jgi:hypothetical protein